MFKEDIRNFINVLTLLPIGKLESLAKISLKVRASGGRIFFLGNGGSAGVASHLVNDFRKLSSIESYAPWDNSEEISAWINDWDWESSLVRSLERSRLSSKDLLFVVSASGGSFSDRKSRNLVRAVEYGIGVGAKVVSILGAGGGLIESLSTLSIKLPNLPIASTNVECLALLVGHWVANDERLRKIK